jgi:hypothetical protein
VTVRRWKATAYCRCFATLPLSLLGRALRLFRAWPLCRRLLGGDLSLRRGLFLGCNRFLGHRRIACNGLLCGLRSRDSSRLSKPHFLRETPERRAYCYRGVFQSLFHFNNFRLCQSLVPLTEHPLWAYHPMIQTFSPRYVSAGFANNLSATVSIQPPGSRQVDGVAISRRNASDNAVSLESVAGQGIQRGVQHFARADRVTSCLQGLTAFGGRLAAGS